MKKAFFILILAVCSLVAYAKPSDVFEYSEEQVVTAMDDIDRLEQYVENNGGSLSELQTNPELTQVYNLNNFEERKPLNPVFSLDEMDWGAFAWGCLCWPIGCIVVVLDRDSENNSKLSFLLGFGTYFLSAVIANVVIYAAYGGLYYY